MARMRKLMMTMGGLCLVVGSLTLSTLALTSSTALASGNCSESINCGGLTPGSGSSPPGGTITLSGHGYAPGATVTISVCGTETVTVTADAKGQFTTSVTIPSGATPGTTCVITASGTGANGQPLTTSTSILVTSGTAVPPPATGEPWAASLYWALAVGTAVLGLSLFEIGRRRRRFNSLS